MPAMTKQPFLDTPFLDTQGIAAYLGVNEKQIYTLIHERGLPATKITGKWLFPVPLVDRWIEASVINMPEQLPFLQDARELLLIAGSDDPLFLKVIGLFRRQYPEVLILESRTGSSDGLLAMGKGLVHLACVHLMDSEGEYSPSYIAGKAGEAAVVAFTERNQGLLLARGNSAGIITLIDATDKGFRWAVRDVGTGTRALLERELDLAGIEAAQPSSKVVLPKMRSARTFGAWPRYMRATPKTCCMPRPATSDMAAGLFSGTSR